MRLALLLMSAALNLAAACAADPAPINVKSLKPGLHATYTSLTGKETLYRIDAKPALALGDSNLHPRLPFGPFSVLWSGVIQFRGEGPFHFDAFVGGEVTVKIDDVVVLQGRGETSSSQINSKVSFTPKRGRARIAIEYRALPGIPARLQLWWQGADFEREPVPAWLFTHSPDEAPASAEKELAAAAGRIAVGSYGCARCHSVAFPAVNDPPPGPTLAGIGDRVGREWLFSFLNDPGKAHSTSRMPVLFKPDREGAVERWLIADYLSKVKAPPANEAQPKAGDHRRGRRDFLRVGCLACHFAPDINRAEQKDLERRGFDGVAARISEAQLVEFLKNPATRYPDGHHPLLPLTAESSRDIAAYLLLWTKSDMAVAPPDPAVTAKEIEQAVQRLGAKDADGAARTLLQTKGCASCHEGAGEVQRLKVPLIAGERGCLSETGTPRFAIDAETKKDIAAYISVAAMEKYPAPVEERRQLIRRLGCFQCHSTNDRQPPLEEASATIGGSNLEAVPFLRTPRLNQAHLKYGREYLLDAIRNGVTGVRHSRYSFRMAQWGAHAESVAQALAEMDGDVPAAASNERPAADPTMTGLGGALIGFEGYSCVSCHVWNGKQLNDGDPGAVGPDLTTITHRIRRDWFNRWLDEPSRIHPGTAMPQIFTRGQPARINTVLDGDAARQKDAIWSYLSLGKDAPSPKPMPPVPVDVPAANAPPMVAQIPIKLPDGKNVESICILYGSHDLLLYDVGETKMLSVYSGAQILRAVRGRLRTFSLVGTPIENLAFVPASSALKLKPQSVECAGHERLTDGVRILLRAKIEERTIEGSESFRLTGRKLSHEIQWSEMPAVTNTIDLPAAKAPPEAKYPLLPDAGPIGGSLERPGYRAIAYPRPKTITGEDLIMPGAIAAHPVDGRVFVASMKMGELFVLRDPTDDGKNATFVNYAGGLFQEAYSMLAEKDGLYLLHRRNLTRIVDGAQGATKFERILELPHGIAETYDYAYGLVRDNTGAFVISYAPYANKKLPGSGSAIRMNPGEKPEELAFGFRNPVGWCTGSDGDIFYTDNQGEWVATNKLCHMVKGRYYGFPNSDQPEHKTKPAGKTAVWVPYAWARSINGVTYNNTGEKFGPFNGQFFMAELMYGGAIIRASLEKVNGEYQGACFPFWCKGLLGPLTLTFDPRGRMFVGSITEPGWMAQPDRGAVFRIDFTGQTPFEIHSINVRPRGFKLNFTLPVDATTAAAITSYSIEHFRYESTGAYGSPELDRSPLTIEKIIVALDGKSVELQTGALTKDRVYMINAGGVKSEKSEPLVQPIGAYTLNEIPDK